jgi:hypothetical protein
MNWLPILVAGALLAGLAANQRTYHTMRALITPLRECCPGVLGFVLLLVLVGYTVSMQVLLCCSFLFCFLRIFNPILL